jgi:hypothetical protein
MVGLFEDPSQPIYNYDRQVQYCSGAALLVRMSELEGTIFDERFAPKAYDFASGAINML